MYCFQVQVDSAVNDFLLIFTKYFYKARWDIYLYKNAGEASEGCIWSLYQDCTTKAAPQATVWTINHHNYLMANETRCLLIWTTTDLVFPSDMIIYKLFMPNCFWRIPFICCALNSRNGIEHLANRSSLKYTVLLQGEKEKQAGAEFANYSQ